MFSDVGGEVAQPLRATCTAMPRTMVILFSKADVYISSTPSYVTNTRGYASCIVYTNDGRTGIHETTQTNRQTNRQTDRQTNKQTNKQTNNPTTPTTTH